MSKTALVSDIHANLEALQAVLDDIDAQGDVDRLYCLGDLVGYGPDPAAVIDIVRRRAEFILLGNHDQAMVTLPVGFSTVAATAIECQRRDLEPGIFSLPKKRGRWQFLQDLPEEQTIGDNIFVHASPRDKIYEYILPGDVTRQPRKFEDIFAVVQARCFVGHTHMPGVFLEGPRFLKLEDVKYEYEFKRDEKAILNVSSVGQPRDRDPRACYAVLSENGVKWRRVEYDIEKTVDKIKQNPCLHDKCGLRLREGR